MDRQQEIENRISELHEELATVQGTPTEIYTRIVGYYRSLKNWNKGKREEYNHRVTFEPGTSGQPHSVAASPVAEVFAQAAMEAASAPPAAALAQTADEEAIQSYAYYYRQTCPNCPPVKNFVQTLDLSGKMVDVDTGEGMAEAIEHQILSTPTVLLMNDRGETVAQAGSVEQLRTILESAG